MEKSREAPRKIAAKSRKETTPTPLERYVPAFLVKDYVTLVEDQAKLSDASTSSFLKKLVGVKSVENAVQLQSEFAKTQFEGFIAQANKIGEIYKDIAREAFKPYESFLPLDGAFARGETHTVVSRTAVDEEPTQAQWVEIKQLAMAQVSADLRSPAIHLDFIRENIARATSTDVE